VLINILRVHFVLKEEGNNTEV